MPLMSAHRQCLPSAVLAVAWIIVTGASAHDALAASSDRSTVDALRRAVQLGRLEPPTLDPRGVALLAEAEAEGAGGRPAARLAQFRPLGPIEPVALEHEPAAVRSSRSSDRREREGVRRTPAALALAVFGAGALLAGRLRRPDGR